MLPTQVRSSRQDSTCPRLQNVKPRKVDRWSKRTCRSGEDEGELGRNESKKNSTGKQLEGSPAMPCRSPPLEIYYLSCDGPSPYERCGIKLTIAKRSAQGDLRSEKAGEDGDAHWSQKESMPPMVLPYEEPLQRWQGRLDWKAQWLKTGRDGKEFTGTRKSRE